VTAALGAYAMQRGDFAEAIRLWDETLAISPALVLVRANLADALLRTGRAEQARTTLRKAFEYNPAFQPSRDLLNRIAK
jgi:tetratricopeptide (TPR) repeat protein